MYNVQLVHYPGDRLKRGAHVIQIEHKSYLEAHYKYFNSYRQYFYKIVIVCCCIYVQVVYRHVS